MTAICTCAMHCPESAYHERACCGQTTCDCWCHRREDAQYARPHAVDYFAVEREGIVDIYDSDGRHLLVLDARLPRALIGRLAAAAMNGSRRAREALEHGVATREGAPASG